MNRIFMITLFAGAILMSAPGNAQDLPLLRGLLETHDLRKLNQYAVSNPEVYAFDYPETNIYWKHYREVVPGYYEGTLQIFYATPASNSYFVFPYRLNVLVKDSFIFYYALKTIDAGGEYRLWRYQDTSRKIYEGFINAFEAFYSSPLNSRYLFIDSISYGTACGAAEITPAEMKAVSRYAQQKDTVSLSGWLKCGNSELQLYAVHGYGLMQKDGYTPGGNTINLIRWVLDKNGNVNICGKTHERTAPIRSLRSSFLFQ